MNNLRDLLGYALDMYDVWLLQHRWYSYCVFVSRTFSAEDTLVERLVQPVFESMLRRKGDSR